MIRRLRASKPVRLALCAAALLSLSAAFGLHPEPTGAAPTGPGIAAKASLAAPAHDCLACLKAGSALLTASSGLAPAATDSAPAIVYRDSDPPARFVAEGLAGRSPPAGVS